jgi:hypothetical protein
VIYLEQRGRSASPPRPPAPWPGPPGALIHVSQFSPFRRQNKQRVSRKRQRPPFALSHARDRMTFEKRTPPEEPSRSPASFAHRSRAVMSVGRFPYRGMADGCACGLVCGPARISMDVCVRVIAGLVRRARAKPFGARDARRSLRLAGWGRRRLRLVITY